MFAHGSSESIVTEFTGTIRILALEVTKILVHFLHRCEA